MEFNRKILSAGDVEEINMQASIFMHEGIRLMADARSEAIASALEYFDRALQLRRSLPIESSPALRYDLAACWLNRADALMRLGNSEQLQLALSAYDEAILLLRDLPTAEDPRFRRRLAIAYQNRGLALQAERPSDISAISAAFLEAIDALEGDESALILDRSYLLATVYANLANACASATDAESVASARDAAQRAISLVSDLERSDADAAEVGLKARHTLCQTIAPMLSAAVAKHGAQLDNIHEATDAADDGLDLARQWEKKGVVRFRAIAHDLFRFGAHVYATFQPQFLIEFAHDNFDPDRSSPEYVGSVEMQNAADEVLRFAQDIDGSVKPNRV
jgi:hypothetical protein